MNKLQIRYRYRKYTVTTVRIQVKLISTDRYQRLYVQIGTSKLVPVRKIRKFAVFGTVKTEKRTVTTLKFKLLCDFSYRTAQ